MKRLLGLFFGAVIGIFALGGEQASAAPIDLGTLAITGGHTTFSSAAAPVDASSLVSQDFLFHLDSDATILASVTASPFPAALFAFTQIGISAIGSIGNVGFTSTLDSLHPLSPVLSPVLSAGDYILSVLSEMPGADTIAFSGFIAATAPGVASTPIPATGLMMLTALGALGFMVSRRKRAGAACGTAAA